MIRRINTTDAANKRMLSWNEAAQDWERIQSARLASTHCLTAR